MPLRWLQRRQMIRMFSGASVPPRLCGSMWSASGEDGSRLASHVRWTWQIGQRSSPAARAACLAAAALWSQRVVPVRDVVMRTSVRLAVVLAGVLCAAVPSTSGRRCGRGGAQFVRG